MAKKLEVKGFFDIFTENHYLFVMHDSRTIANQFLSLARARGLTLTPMQLLKLVYIAHGWSLGLYGRALIADEVQAWQYGPVIPRLYNATKDWRGQPVDEILPARADDNLSASDTNLIQQVFDLYGSKSGPALSRLTHASGTPWATTYDTRFFGIAIPNDIIRDHYQQLARQRTAR